MYIRQLLILYNWVLGILPTEFKVSQYEQTLIDRKCPVSKNLVEENVHFLLLVYSIYCGIKPGVLKMERLSENEKKKLLALKVLT